MKIMTFNLRCDFIFDFKNRWDNRKGIAFNILKSYKCDIIGLQEVTNKMFIDIKNNMEDYYVIGDPRSKRLFVERNDILISKKYKVVDFKTFWLSEKPDKIGSSKWYSLFPRICTTAIVEIEEGSKVRICNTHLDCLLPNGREYGLRKVVEYIEMEQEKEYLPIILMGDFNATPESKVIKEFKDGKYYDKKLIAAQEHNKEIYKHTTMSMFKGKEKGMHIDYIFVSEDIDISEVKIIKDNLNGKYPSDHYPLMCEINLKTLHNS
ncbi:endonuclease/exonuclease/phosphatase family protein [Clostridium paraputrificum]|uniref:endonuclease/exonuclease/phosphatase family protein n=1 Tax=Clostridium TaxID=1485 RepID=UPI003D33B439